MSVKNHIIVECFDHYKLARGSAFSKNALWYTTSPYLIDRLRHEGETVIWLDELADHGTANHVGLASIAASQKLANSARFIAEELKWPKLPMLVCMQLHRLLSVLIFKQTMLNNWLSQTKGHHTVMGSTELSLEPRSGMGIGIYDTVYAALASQMADAPVDIIQIPHTDQTHLLSEVDKPTALTRLISYSDVSIGQIFYRSWRLLGFPNIPGLRADAPHIGLLNFNNETIREILPNLALRGCNILNIALPNMGKADLDPAFDLNSQEIATVLHECATAEGIAGSWLPIAKIVADRLRATSKFWQPSMQIARDHATTIQKQNGISIVISSTLRGYTNSAFAAVLSQRKVPITVVQHGFSAGLSRYHIPFRDFSEAVSGDHYLVCAQGTRNFFESTSHQHNVEIDVIGLAKQTRKIPNKILQRFLVRHYLKCKSSDRVIFYVAGTEQNNVRFLPYMPEDYEIHNLQRTMADEVLPKLRGVPVLKLYATRRHRDPDPLADEFRAPEPVRTLKFGDFRFLRSAADIIIVDSPLSTLGWVFGADKPIVYLAHPSFPILPDIGARLENSVFYFDLSDAEWTGKLISCLNRTDIEIGVDWKSKEASRIAFTREYVFGPEGAGRNGANSIFSILDW